MFDKSRQPKVASASKIYSLLTDVRNAPKTGMDAKLPSFNRQLAKVRGQPPTFAALKMAGILPAISQSVWHFRQV